MLHATHLSISIWGGMEMSGEFSSFLSESRVINETRVKYYVYWVKGYLVFCGHDLAKMDQDSEQAYLRHTGVSSSIWHAHGGQFQHLTLFRLFSAPRSEHTGVSSSIWHCSDFFQLLEAWIQTFVHRQFGSDRSAAWWITSPLEDSDSTLLILGLHYTFPEK